MSYSTGSHTVFHHRYHIVWVPKYRYKVLAGEVRERVRDIVRQVCTEMGVRIVGGVLSLDHVHMFVEIPPHIAVSQFVQRAKQRAFLTQDPAGVPPIAQKVLGQTVLGARILLHDQW